MSEQYLSSDSRRLLDHNVGMGDLAISPELLTGSCGIRDLLACLRACHERGLSKHVRLSWREQMQIVRVNRYYKSKELEYFAPRAKSFGSVEQLASAIDRVSKGVFNPITESTFPALPQET